MALKLLLVDDDLQALNFLKAVVEPLGFEVLAFQDSRQAAEQLGKQKFHGIITDAQMPHLDGFRLTEQVRTSPTNSQIPIVMVTADDDVATMRKAYSAGITFLLGKPYGIERMRGLLNGLRANMLREKRRYVRLPLRTEVQCQANGRQHKSHSVNLSESGMLLELAEQSALAGEIALQFILPAASLSLTPRGQIVRQEPPRRLGIKYILFDAAQTQALRDFIAGVVRD